MKVLWFSNIFISDSIQSTGTWIFTMSRSLIDSENVELINITDGDVPQVEFIDNGRLKQWIIPRAKLTSGLPDKITLDKIVEIVKNINPDIVHVWGTENYWGLLFSRGLIKSNVLLDIQGLKFICYKYFFVGLNYTDILNCIVLKDILKPRYSILGRAKSFKSWGKYELEIIKGINCIGVQSDWVRSQISMLNPNASLFRSKIRLREPFLKANKWNKNNCEPFRIFTSTSNVISYKGLHVLIDALQILKYRYPNVKLYVAGHVTLPGIRQNGYDKFLFKKIKKNDLLDNVVWLGPLDANSLVKELLSSNVCVIPSFIESYCVALDEALSLGVPTVVSNAGAMSELANHEFSALYYSPLNSVDCATQIEKYFSLDFGEIISQNSLKSRTTYSTIDYAEAQLSVYRSIINKDKNE